MLPLAIYFRFSFLYLLMIFICLALSLSLSGFIFFSIVLTGIILSRFTVSNILLISFFIFLGGQFIINSNSYQDYEGIQYLSTNIEIIVSATEDLLYGSSFDIEQSASILDRYWSFIGPLAYSLEDINIFGYGFGSDTIYWENIFERDIAANLAEVKAEGRPQISSHFSKLLLFGGFFGLSMFWFIFFLQFYNSDRKSIFFGLSIFVISFFALAQFHLFLIYFWIAFIGNAYER